MQQVGLRIGEPVSDTSLQLSQHLGAFAYPEAYDFQRAVSQDVSRYRDYCEKRNLGPADLVAELDRTAGLQTALLKSAVKVTTGSNYDVHEKSQSLDLTTAHRFSEAVYSLNRGHSPEILHLGPNYQGVEKILIALNWHRFIFGALLYGTLPTLTDKQMNPTSIYRGTLLRRVHIGSDATRPLFVRHLGQVVQIPGQADFGCPGNTCPITFALSGAGSGNDINGNEDNRKHDAIVIEVPEVEWKGLHRCRGEYHMDYTLRSESLANLRGVKLWAVRP